MTQQGRGHWAWPLLVGLVTAAYALIPYLISSTFYQRGDTAAQFAPTWFRFGELVRDGVWPIWIDPGAWAGGNYVGEALFGTYNPLNILIWLGVSLGPDLVVSVLVVKVVLMVLLALGTYVLAREYDAARWASAVVAVALPFSGFTLFWDAGSWPVSLMAFMYAPWVWTAFRRTLRGVGNPLWAFLAGALAVTHGYPYGTLAVVVIGAALVVEGIVMRAWGGVLRVVVAGLLVAALLPLVYMPLLASSDLAVRSSGALFENIGKMRPATGDLLALSSPLHVPPIQAITGPMQVPATYLAWFVLPLLPWLRYATLRARAKEMTGLVVISAIYLALTLGPSKLWLFRWPLRLVEYFYLGLFVVLAVLISQGLARDQIRGRAVGTLLIIATMGWLTWSQDPSSWARAGLGTAVVAAGTAALLAGHLWLRRVGVVAATAILGVGAVVTLQVSVLGENEGSRGWYLPSDVESLRAEHSELDGRVMHFVNLKPLQRSGNEERLNRFYEHVLPGSMYHVAGVEAVNNYTGMGFLPFTQQFCMEYDGMTWRCGYPQVWRAPGPSYVPMADLMKLDTVVVQNQQIRKTKPADGWEQTSSNKLVTVYERTTPHAFGDSELAWAAEEIDVVDAETVDRLHQRVEIAGADHDADLLFSMLGWPGWEAELEGQQLKVDHDSSGFLRVLVPEGSEGTLEVTYRPPGLTVGLVGAGLGVLGALVFGLFVRRRARNNDM